MLTEFSRQTFSEGNKDIIMGTGLTQEHVQSRAVKFEIASIE
jgi:hypothetical protein